MTRPSANPVSQDVADTPEPTVTEFDQAEHINTTKADSDEPVAPSADEANPTDPADGARQQDTATDVTEIAETPASFAEGQSPTRDFTFARLLAFGILPTFAFVLALGAGYLRWTDSTVRDAELARTQSVRAATEATVAMLSYRPDTADKDLVAARDRMTGAFRDSYIALTNNAVIPGAKQKQISAVASVPAAASVSARDTHAVVLVFVDQTTVIGDGAPTDTASTVKVTLDKVHGRWLISQFEPV
jgi:Mce-associated membrane protein